MSQSPMRRSANAAAAMLPPGFLRPMAEPGLWPSVALALLVHLLLALFLVFGLRWSTKPPDTVVVELWGAQLPPATVSADQAEPAPVVEEPPPPPPPPAPPPRPAPQPVNKAVAEPEPKPAPKPDIALKKADKAIDKKQDKKADKKAEKKADKKADRKDDLRFDLDQQMKEQLAREMSAVQRDRPRADAAASPSPSGNTAAPQREGALTGNSARQSAEYQARIRAKIKANIAVPSDISGNPEAVFDVVQLPTGEVLGEPRLVKSSGHRGYDEAVLRAILKSQPLPRPERPDLFVRELRLNFTPRE